MSIRSPKKPDDEWEDISADNEWEDVDTNEFPTSKKERSTLGKIIDYGTTPLTDAPSRFARSISERLDRPTAEGKIHPLAAFGAGAIEGLGDIVSGFTAPFDLAATALTGGAFGAANRGLRGLANTMRQGARVASIPVAYHGGETLLDPEKTLGERAFGLAELAGGAAGMHFPEAALRFPESKPSAGKPIPKPKAEPITEPTIRPEDAAARALEKQYESTTKTPEQIAADEALLNKLFPNLEKSDPRFRMSGEGMETSYPTRKESMAREQRSAEDRSIRHKLSRFAEDEEGSFDPDFLSRRFPGDEAVELGEIPGREIDLEQAALEAASDTALPAGRGFSDKAKQFLLDESGEFNPGAIFREPQSPLEVEHAFDWPGFGKEGEAEPMFHVRGGPEDKSTLSRSNLRERGMKLNEPLNEFSPDISQFNEPIGQFGPEATSPRFEQRGTPEFEQARMNELFDKEIAGTLTGDELAEAKILYKKLNPQNFKPESIAPLEAPKQSGFMQSIKDFLADESGEADFFGREQASPEERVPFRRLLAEEDLAEGLPVKERESLPQEEPSMARQIWDLPRGTMSVDLPFLTSAAFRQASPLAWTKGWFNAWGKSAKAFGSEEAYKTIMSDINNSEFFKPRYKPSYDAKGNLKGYKEVPGIAEEAGVKMSDMGRVSAREEQIRGSLAERIPGWGKYIKASNRAYTAFLNSARKSQFESMMKQANFTGGENDIVLAKQIAEFINDATGRSPLKLKIPGKELNFEKNAEVLANALWSPRLLASRIRMLNPMTYTGLEPQVRQEYVKGLMRSAATWMGFAGLASLAGAKVNLDPTNADFGKIRIGDTRIDPGAGFQQVLVFAARMAPESQYTGKYTSSVTGKTSKYGEGFKGRTRADVAEDFAASKLHPTLKRAYDLLRANKERPVHLGDRAVQMALPMMAQDIAEVMKGNPDLAVGMAPLSSVGFGTSTYGGKDSMSDPVFTDSIEQFLGMPKKSMRGTIKGF